jgi:D-galactosamine 6-phosphate deaminase/isomerase
MTQKNVEKYLGYDEEQLEKLGGTFTAKEIAGQPRLWQNTVKSVLIKKAEIEDFLGPVLNLEDLNIIFTGAGTSAFIGDTVAGIFQKNTGRNCKSVASTQIVTHPHFYFQKHLPTLLISFARSGNSPESVKAYELANQFCERVFHFVITCNPEGKLAKEANKENSLVFLLPPEADDQSLAMTGSFSSMLLTAILLSRLDELDVLNKQIELLISYGSKIIENSTKSLKDAAGINFQRAVFLGSGPMEGIARESHLKLQELSDGKVICKFDSFLGFRHGPKAVIDENTLMFYLFSTDAYASKYEVDLNKTVSLGQKGIYSIGVMERPLEEINVDLPIVLSGSTEFLDKDLWVVCSVLPAQIFGFHKSVHLKLKPDNPSESGTITRVVQGVKLYSYPKDKK